MQRLDKILSEAGVASRKELRNMIRAGRVCVNGVAAKSPEDKYDETRVYITVDGAAVARRRNVLLMLHKPAGYITATEDPVEKTVMELLPEEYRQLQLRPVGRLDKETEGLLLFTNDGDLAHRIISPKSEIWKTYLAEHEGCANEEDVQAFLSGIVLKDETVCLPAVLQPLGPGKSLVKVREGKYHQVRRMLASRGMHVNYLKRVSEGGISLGDLPVGQCMEVSEESLYMTDTGKNAQGI